MHVEKLFLCKNWKFEQTLNEIYGRNSDVEKGIQSVGLKISWQHLVNQLQFTTKWVHDRKIHSHFS